jgi:hypothetical protein
MTADDFAGAVDRLLATAPAPTVTDAATIARVAAILHKPSDATTAALPNAADVLTDTTGTDP